MKQKLGGIYGGEGDCNCVNRSIKIFRPGSALILALFPEIENLNELDLEPKAVHGHIYLFHMCVVYPLPGRKCFDGRLEQFENTFVEITLNMFA